MAGYAVDMGVPHSARIRRVTEWLPVLAAVLLLAGCDRQTVPTPTSSAPSHPSSPTGIPTTPGELVPPQSSRSVSVPSAISPAQLRHKTCEDLLPRMNHLRTDSGQAAANRAVDDAIANFPTTPDWPVLTSEQQQAAIDGAHDSATGKCR
ncbi:hypothetical protein [Nocardia terpenica]|uniref:hypothetical protein n=1 Tax=Nocardia terpenica TaxID=455432 RepID=UPI00142E2DCA|nr:hypothetical protein [Nocardia terpenica]